MLAPVLVGMQDLKKAKRTNRKIQWMNMFSKEKKAFVPITTTKVEIKAKAEEQKANETPNKVQK